MKAIILDTVTGKIKKAWHNADSTHWYEGNWSCDCNRNYFGVDEEDDGYCVGGKRFLVIEAEFEIGEVVYTLDELNEGYPKELRDKFLLNSGWEMVDGVEIQWDSDKRVYVEVER